MVVADEHDLGARELGVADESPEATCVDHAGLVHDQYVSLVEDPGRLVQIDQEPGHGRGRDTRGGLELVAARAANPRPIGR